MNKSLIFLCLISLSGMSSANSGMKLEGSCRGQLKGSAISLKYYSAFDGCKPKSSAEISISGRRSKLKGLRVLENGFDTYSFKNYWLVFPDSTGNTQGEFRYRDTGGMIKSVQLECEIRDYEYSECSGL